MIFFTDALNDDEVTKEEEIDDTDASLADEVLDELGGEEDDDVENDTEGFGLIDDEDEDEDEDKDDTEKEEVEEETLDELEEDAEEMDYDRFDDVDEL